MSAVGDIPGVSKRMPPTPGLEKWNELIDSLVWLTRNRRRHQRWQTGDPQKSEIRITVDVDNARPWPSVARRSAFPRSYYNSLAKTGGNPDEWHVVEGPVPSSAWIKVERTDTGEILWAREPDEPETER
jgi:hypothetical protein